MSQPQALANNLGSRRLSSVDKDHPSYVPTFEEQLALLKAVERQHLVGYHQQFFGADNMLVTIVGDFDRDSVVATLEEHFGNWITREQHQPIVLDYQPIDTTPAVIDTPDKENGTFFAINLYEVDAYDKDMPELALGNYIFGGGFVNSRLATRLRQQEGWSYGAGSSFNPGRLSPRSVFWGWAIGAPQNLGKIENGFKEELQLLLDDGFTQEEIEQGISGMLQGRKVERADDEKLSQMLNQMMYYSETLDQYQQFEADLADSSGEETRQVMKKYFSPDNMLYIKAGDMAKAAEKSATASSSQ